MKPMLARVVPVALAFPLLLGAQEASKDVSGIWLGTLTAGSHHLRLQLHLQTGTEGTVGCAFDSVDQRAFQVACTLTVKGNQVLIQVPAVTGTWTGQLAADGRTLTGIWAQGSDLPLSFTRQDTAITAPPLL